MLADLSLDRAAAILPLVNFPPVNPSLVQSCIDEVGQDLKPGQENVEVLLKKIRIALYGRLGGAAHSVGTWLQTFAFADEVTMPALSYWDLRFADLMALSPAPVPSGVDATLWGALVAAYQGVKSEPGYPWTAAFDTAASLMLERVAIARAIAKARGEPLTPHDLDIYMRFGWNDHGTQKGLTSLEMGSRLSSMISFWRQVSGHVPAEEIEALAYQRDMELWEAAANPSLFAADAERYGVAAEQMAADMFPKPNSPPRLRTLLEDT